MTADAKKNFFPPLENNSGYKGLRQLRINEIRLYIKFPIKNNVLLKVTDWASKSEKKSLNWWDQFVEGLRIDILEDICHQILDLYATQQAAKNTGSNNTSTTPTKSSSTTNNINNNGQSNSVNHDSNEGNTPTKKVKHFLKDALALKLKIRFLPELYGNLPELCRKKVSPQ